MPAVSRFGVPWFAVVTACWTAPATPTQAPVVASMQPGGRDVSGNYWCTIDDDGFEYPKYPCAIKKVGEDLVLAKLAGSQRVKGRIKLNGDGFSFVGQMYCPYGDCDQVLHGSFRSTGN